MLKLYKIAKNPEKMVFNELWETRWSALPFEHEYTVRSWACGLASEFSKTEWINKQAKFMNDFETWAETKKLKIIINRNLSLRAKRSGGESLDRIDFCFHDSNRLAANTCFTFYFNRYDAKILFLGRKTISYHFSDFGYFISEVVSSLENSKSAPISFISKPHLSASGNNRKHEQRYHQKISDDIRKSSTLLVSIIIGDFLFRDLRDETCRPDCWLNSPFDYANWPFSRLKIRHLEQYYAIKDSGNPYRQKPIIDNGLISEIFKE